LHSRTTRQTSQSVPVCRLGRSAQNWPHYRIESADCIKGIASLFSGAAVGAPFFTPEPDEERVPLAVQCERLLLDLQDANRRLAETDEHLSRV
jgi:hypothetical protein